MIKNDPELTKARKFIKMKPAKIKINGITHTRESELAILQKKMTEKISDISIKKSENNSLTSKKKPWIFPRFQTLFIDPIEFPVSANTAKKFMTHPFGTYRPPVVEDKPIPVVNISEITPKKIMQTYQKLSEAGLRVAVKNNEFVLLQKSKPYPNQEISESVQKVITALKLTMKETHESTLSPAFQAHLGITFFQKKYIAILANSPKILLVNAARIEDDMILYFMELVSTFKYTAKSFAVG
jgi:hypothetical protein